MLKRIKNNDLYHIEFNEHDLSEKAFAYYCGTDAEITQARRGLHKGAYFLDGEPLGGGIEDVDEALSALYDDLPWWEIDEDEYTVAIYGG